MYQIQSEQEVALRQLLKRRNLYTVLFVIALLGGGTLGIIPAIGWYVSAALLAVAGIFAGLGLYCINCYRYTKSNGAKKGGGLWWWILFLFGLIFIPAITVFIVGRIRPLAEKLLGVELK